MLFHPQILGAQSSIAPQRIAKGEVRSPRFTVELDHVKQVGSFAAVTPAPKDEVSGDAGILSVVVAELL